MSGESESYPCCAARDFRSERSVSPRRSFTSAVHFSGLSFWMAISGARPAVAIVCPCGRRRLDTLKENVRRSRPAPVVAASADGIDIEGSRVISMVVALGRLSAINARQRGRLRELPAANCPRDGNVRWRPNSFSPEPVRLVLRAPPTRLPISGLNQSAAFFARSQPSASARNPHLEYVIPPSANFRGARVFQGQAHG